MNDLVSIIIVTAGISLLLNTIFKRANIHTIIGYILTGAIIAFALDLQNTKNEFLDMIAEFGIAFLMFSIGLEFSISKLKTIKTEVFFYGGMQVALTSTIFFLIFKFIFQLTPTVALIISLALALSSTAIVLKLLNDSHKIYKIYGKNAIGVLLFQDMAVIPILLLISILANTQNNVGTLLLETFISTLTFLALMLLLGRYLLPIFLDFTSNTKSDEIFISAILLLVIGSAELAHIFGFPYSLGTFIAGIFIAKTHYKYQIEADLIPFRDLLLGIFFISVGMQLNVFIIPANIGIILTILFGVIIIKAGLIFLIIHLFYKTQTSLKTAIILAQVGEFSFVIFELAKINGLFLETELSQIIMIVIIFSMILTPFIFNHLHIISRWFIDKNADNDDLVETSDLKDHVIVCGYGGLGQKVVERLKKMNIPYIAIERDRKLIQHGIHQKDVVIFGNAGKRSLLKKINITEARAVIIAMSTNKDLQIVGNAIRDSFPEIKILASASNLGQKRDLEKINVTYIVNEMEITADSLLEFIVGESV